MARAFDFDDAQKDFGYSPLSFAEGIAREISVLENLVTLVVMPQDDQAFAHDLFCTPDALFAFPVVEQGVGLYGGCVHMILDINKLTRLLKQAKSATTKWG